MIAGIAVAVVAAAAGAYSAYAASEASQQQAQAAKNNANLQNQLQQQANDAAKTAKMNQDAYITAQKQRTILSAAAGAGVGADSGSLLEDTKKFAADSNYKMQLDTYGYSINSWQAGNALKYQSDLFGWQKKQLASTEGQNIAIAGLGGGASASAGLLKSSSGNNTGTGDALQSENQL